MEIVTRGEAVFVVIYLAQKYGLGAIGSYALALDGPVFPTNNGHPFTATGSQLTRSIITGQLIQVTSPHMVDTFIKLGNSLKMIDGILVPLIQCRALSLTV